MKHAFLCKNFTSKELIIVAGGFSSHPSHFAHLKSDKNVLLLYDFENFNLNFDFKAFSNLTLVAFSIGVSLASSLLKNLDFKQKIALNGTNLGIDKTKGIHPAIFAKTIKNFSLNGFKTSLLKQHEILAKDFLFKDEKALERELENLFHFVLKNQNENFTWDRVYSSNKDEIFPQNALKNSFKNLIFLNEPHFAFFHFKTWDAL